MRLRKGIVMMVMCLLAMVILSKNTMAQTEIMWDPPGNGWIGHDVDLPGEYYYTFYEIDEEGGYTDFTEENKITYCNDFVNGYGSHVYVPLENYFCTWRYNCHGYTLINGAGWINPIDVVIIYLSGALVADLDGPIFLFSEFGHTAFWGL